MNLNHLMSMVSNTLVLVKDDLPPMRNGQFIQDPESFPDPQKPELALCETSIDDTKEFTDTMIDLCRSHESFNFVAMNGGGTDKCLVVQFTGELDDPDLVKIRINPVSDDQISQLEDFGFHQVGEHWWSGSISLTADADVDAGVANDFAENIARHIVEKRLTGEYHPPWFTDPEPCEVQVIHADQEPMGLDCVEWLSGLTAHLAEDFLPYFEEETLIIGAVQCKMTLREGLLDHKKKALTHCFTLERRPNQL